jgi:hypothetical protein
LTGREVKMVLNDKEGNVFVDGKVRRDEKFPAGFMGKVLAFSKLYLNRCPHHQEDWRELQSPLRYQGKIRFKKHKV